MNKCRNRNTPEMQGKERISFERLRAFCKEALVREGMSEENALRCADVLVETDGVGVYSHGTANLFNYIRKKRAGGVSFTAEPEVVLDGPAYAVIDGHNAMGMISSCKAVELACQKAQNTGISLVAVRNSCHYGAAGYYSNLAARKGMICLSLSNVDPNMNVPGAKGKAIGNNPIAYSAPIEGERPMNLDISCSNVASLRVINAKKRGEEIPNTWIVDGEGHPTTDPSCYPEQGAMLPMGAHKGYGLALLVELLTAILASGEYSSGGNIVSWCFELEKPNQVCHSFIVIDPTKFMAQGVAEKRIKEMALSLRNAPKAAGVEEIRIPGEGGWRNWAQFHEEGIPLPENVFGSLRELGQNIGLEFPETSTEKEKVE